MRKNSVRKFVLASLVVAASFGAASSAFANCTSQAGAVGAVPAGSIEYFTATSNYKVCNGSAWEVIQLTSTANTCTVDRGRQYNATLKAPTVCSGTSELQSTCASSGSTSYYYCVPENEVKIFPTSQAANTYFGKAVAMSGTSMIVGAPGGNGGKGAAYVFVLGSNGWQQQQMLTAANGAVSDNFGQSVAIYGDTAVVGAPNRTVGANANQGGAYVFTRSGTIWTEQVNGTASYPTITAIPAAEGSASDNMGTSVAIYNGEIAVGAPSTAAGGTVYFYYGSGASWTYQTKLAPAAAGNKFGSALSYDSTTLFIGAPSTANGSVYVYTGSLASWSLQTTLTGVAVGDKFGSSVFVSSNDAVVGAPGASSNKGAAYYYSRSGTTWSAATAITAAAAVAGDLYGTSVGYYNGYAVIGAPGKTTNTGYVSIFSGATTTWAEVSTLVASDVTTNKYYGYAVAINSQGFAVGAYGAKAMGVSNEGAVYMETLTFLRQRFGNDGVTGQSATTGVASDNLGASVTVIDGDTLATSNSARINTTANAGGVWIYRKNTSTGVWTQESFIAGVASSGQLFGSSLALQGNVLVIGAQGDSSGNGAWYYATRTGVTWALSAKQTNPEGAPTTSDHLGFAVGFDGSELAVSAYGRAGTQTGQGRVYLYSFNGTTFTYTGIVNPPAGDVTVASFFFGYAVSLKGSVLFIGAKGNATNLPKLYVYNKGGAWAAGTATAVTISSVSVGSADGLYISGPASMAFDGTTVVIGARNPLAQYALAFQYSATTSTWVDTKLTPNDKVQGANFGGSVAVNGSYVVVGSDNFATGANTTGAAYLFKRSGSGYTQVAKYIGDSTSSTAFGLTVAISPDQIFVAAKNSAQYSPSVGAMYVYTFGSPISSCGYANATGTNSKFVVNTVAATLTSSVFFLPASYTLAVCVGMKGDTITSVSYGGSNKAVPDAIGNATSATPTRAAIFLFPNSTGANVSSSIILTGTSSANTKGFVYAYLQGVVSAAYADGNAGAGGAANASFGATGNVTTTNANDLLLGCAVNNASYDATSYWDDPLVPVIKDSSTGVANANGHLSIAFGSKPVTATTTYTASRSGFTSSDWAISALAVKSTGSLPTQAGQCITNGSCVNEGAINYDTTGNKLYWCDGSFWNQIYSQ